MYELKIKRAYLSPVVGDGYRILIDKLWPRGISKEKAEIDEWAKSITPSAELRRWFGHKEENYAEFARKYRAELDGNPLASQFADAISELLTTTNVTLIYGAKNEHCNHAIILRDWIVNHIP